MGTKAVIDVNEFRARHDKNVVIPAKIRAALANMAKEHPERWCYEGNDAEVGEGILARAGVSTTDLAMFRAQFEAHIVETPKRNGKSTAKRVWFATTAAAKKATGG